MDDKVAEVKFNFFELRFTPHNDSADKTSKNILKECIKLIDKERTENQKAIAIDLHEGRKGEKSRIIFVSTSAYIASEKKYKCRMALLRDDKIPQLVDRTTYTLTPFDQLGDHTIAETTNFYIDVSTSTPVVCCEFNNFGPRILDVEAYFRFLSSHRMLHISKACKASIHMKVSVNEVLDSITDVLKFNIKARPRRLAHISQSVEGPFLLQMQALANSVEPKSIRVESFFRERGTSSRNSKKNIKAVKFVKKFLESFKDDLKVAEDFEDFVLEFEKDDGSEDVFNLLKGRQEIIVSCPYETSGNYNTKALYTTAVAEFDSYLSQRRS